MIAAATRQAQEKFRAQAEPTFFRLVFAVQTATPEDLEDMVAQANDVAPRVGLSLDALPKVFELAAELLAARAEAAPLAGLRTEFDAKRKRYTYWDMGDEGRRLKLQVDAAEAADRLALSLARRLALCIPRRAAAIEPIEQQLCQLGPRISQSETSLAEREQSIENNAIALKQGRLGEIVRRGDREVKYADILAECRAQIDEERRRLEPLKAELAKLEAERDALLQLV